MVQKIEKKKHAVLSLWDDTKKLADAENKTERMEYKPPQVDVDPIKKKTIKYPAEYEEITVKPDFEGKMKDVDFGLDSYEEILEEVGESKIKKAGGGLAYMLGE